MNAYAVSLIAAFIFIAGCCAPTTPSSPSISCPYGTYDETCTAVCQISGGENCVPDCMNSVRSYGLGDATTCCKETFRQHCQSTCAKEVAINPEMSQGECMQECEAVGSAGYPMDSCYLPFS